MSKFNLIKGVIPSAVTDSHAFNLVPGNLIAGGGVDALPALLTINSVGYTPDLRYRGDDGADSWAAWDYGAGLAILEGGDAPEYNVEGDWGDLVSYNTGDCHFGADTADLDYRDFVIEGVFEFTSTVLTAPTWACKQNQFNQNGWSMYRIAAGNLYMHIYYSPTNRYLASSAVSEGVHHVMVFADRDESVGSYAWCVYIDGVYDGASSIVEVNNNITSPAAFKIGGCAIGRDLCDADVGYFAMWHGEDWFAGGSTNRDHWDAVAASRYALL